MKRILLSLVAIFVIGCEGMKVLAVSLVSAETMQPIPDADVYFLDRKGVVLDSARTDSIGQVVFDSGFTGMSFGGPKFRYRIVKTGYSTINGAEKWPQSTVKMVKEQNNPLH